MAINAFDSNGYMLKVNLFVSECSDYQNLQSLKEKLKEDPAFYARCAAILGPHQPGITQPDPTYTGAQEVHKQAAPKTQRKQRAPSAPNVAPSGGDKPSKKEIDKARRKAEELKQKLEDTLGIDLPDLPTTPALPQVPAAPALPNGASSADAEQLLDFLLGP
jgi:hypothetical protein